MRKAQSSGRRSSSLASFLGVAVVQKSSQLVLGLGFKLGGVDDTTTVSGNGWRNVLIGLVCRN